MRSWSTRFYSLPPGLVQLLFLRRIMSMSHAWLLEERDAEARYQGSYCIPITRPSLLWITPLRMDHGMSYQRKFGVLIKHHCAWLLSPNMNELLFSQHKMARCFFYSKNNEAFFSQALRISTTKPFIWRVGNLLKNIATSVSRETHIGWQPVLCFNTGSAILWNVMTMIVNPFTQGLFRNIAQDVFAFPWRVKWTYWYVLISCVPKVSLYNDLC